MSTFSTSLYGSSTNKGIGGLMSGLDTDELVEQLASATKNKINRQYQAKQKLLYRQEAYREISSKLLKFSDKYFSYSSGSKTNILSPKFFEAYTFKSSSNYVSVTGNAENIKNFEINSITSVATAASFTSNHKVSSGVVKSEEITNYVSSLAGETMTFEYKEKSYSITIDSNFGKGSNKVTLEDVANELNKQLAKLKDEKGQELNLKYEVKDNKIVFAEDSDTAKLTAASKDILDFLNFKTGQEASSKEEINSEKIDKLSLTKESILSNKDSYITFEFNGVLKTINLAEKVKVPKTDGTGLEEIELSDPDSLTRYLQYELNKAYGEGKITVKYDNYSIKDEDGNDITKKGLIFEVEGKTNIFGISSISKDLSNLTGLESGDYNRLNITKPITELGLDGITEKNSVELSNGNKGFILNINNVDIEIEATMSIKDVINKINSHAEAGVRVYYSSTTDTFTVKATETGKHKGISIGDSPLAKALFGSAGDDYEIKPGTDTEITYTLNGVKNTITRSTSNFTIDEINIELNEKAVDSTKEGPITFDVINNVDEVVEKVKEFINEYNEIISLISTKTSERPSRSYLPLTPEQKEEMKEDEIENWTKEAKKGALYGDSKMQILLRRLRSAMTGFTDVSSISLSSIGISSASMDTSGKLVFDENKFKEKLLQNPDEIANLFTLTSSKTGDDARSGIAIQLQQILRDNVGAYGTTGLLIEEAGMDNSMTADQNFISKKVKEYDKKIEELKKDLQAEKERYWKQFSALEQSLNRLNMQSGWLTDMMGN